MNNRRFLKPKEVALELNCNVYTVYGLLKSGRLAGIKLGTHWRVKRTDFNKFIREGGIHKQ